MKIYHEAPKSIFGAVQNVTDGDYALVHLLEKDPEYRELFRNGRDVILDNSIFELGESFKGETFAAWVRELKPSWYIVPDVLEDADATIEEFFKFINSYPDLPGKRIGVIQGKTISDCERCYRALEPHCDKIAFSFDFSWFCDPDAADASKEHAMAVGRNALLRHLEGAGVINVDKPHHLLGCALPQELSRYRFVKWIDSVDTSNPVVHGLHGIRYQPGGPGLHS